MSAVRLCRDCKHIEGGERCKAPQNSEDRAPDFVNGIGQATRLVGSGLRLSITGQLQAYTSLYVLGVVVAVGVTFVLSGALDRLVP